MLPCSVCLLFLAWVSVNRAQVKRQRVGEVDRAPGAVQDPAWAPRSTGQAGRDGPDCPFPLLPWVLLVALCGSLTVYLLFGREQGEWPLAIKTRFGPMTAWLKDRHLLHRDRETPEAADGGPESDARPEETLLRDVSGVLHIIRHRLWQIVRDRRKQQRPLQESQ